MVIFILSKIIKPCKKHGDTLHRKDKDSKGSRYRCIKCASLAVSRRREKLKLLAVEYLGGKCKHCGYNKCAQALEFHHLDPNEKDFGFSAKGLTRSFDYIKPELDKCLLLCANCHREEHERLRKINP